ncbi:pyruvate dehydrogenase (acetyl-transferring) E1 component subunit alpha [Cellulomonas fimi]|uniref:Pyruvate dehydrogenase (Acetyl-transferring) E1 component, alpha subunit n=1 Tax=Cellulomonas fimi (strain ATCC 484 / DSM 20113 / JCM 1341 / CCUG 24087 / LMG 16345 / NBRC 15513 / NCIMB 8980 / NCTC 7547 / NRS-133) TaxID=590998 RepID=F4H580_CELFA|nr:pyruvate dehydrogenase (acetyl-transferring) E1 component subunit alpha [Cellulomonas fimi]AEE46686.1 pyruvate dehydrogenase (acetyl-transferring) E1 component, alpha subunit [Cellulomonas fimi ATCC 484]NNH07669.1 pyruvate dehydrogenase (acetyl-transferring) E1 component subunit alpha [Cellulomonas fimi]VEH33882.1 Pyruvate dehydrogenase E1 component subunit alpha [Cellulomonas fimi]
MLRSDVSAGPARTSPHDHGAAAPTATRDGDVPSDEGDLVRLLTPAGTRLDRPEHDPWVADVDDDALLALYEDMVVVRRFDTEAVALQRQGQLGLWPPLNGQEAAQVGSARALRANDFVFGSYRENGVAYCRGATPTDLVRVWRGTTQSGWDPRDLNMATPQIVVGAQALHATGYALGCRLDGVDSAVVAYFGDGATSQGDVHEAMVFAASGGAPVVFFCQNNQWAISEPVDLQTRTPIATRAAGYGFPGVRVDGNDVLAVLAVTRAALDRARRGEGPTLVEAVTYRMGPHTTSDDPTRYADPAVREHWTARDPVTRVERLLRARGALDDEGARAVAGRADAFAQAMRDGCYALTPPPSDTLFDHVLVEPTAWLERQRREHAAYRAMLEGDAS